MKFTIITCRVLSCVFIAVCLSSVWPDIKKSTICKLGLLTPPPKCVKTGSKIAQTGRQRYPVCAMMVCHHGPSVHITWSGLYLAVIVNFSPAEQKVDGGGWNKMLMCFQSSKCIFILEREEPRARSIANSSIYIHFRMLLGSRMGGTGSRSLGVTRKIPQIGSGEG